MTLIIIVLPGFSKIYEKLVYGIREVAYEWFKSYLSNRYQYVHFNGHSSSRIPITCGVPQGSILGPLLFLIYINDICHVAKMFHLILFADDTNIFLWLIII